MAKKMLGRGKKKVSHALSKEQTHVDLVHNNLKSSILSLALPSPRDVLLFYGFTNPFGVVNVYKGTFVGKVRWDNVANGHRRQCCSWGNSAFWP